MPESQPDPTRPPQSTSTDQPPPAGPPTTAPFRGAVPRIEKQYAHQDFLTAATPETALINIVHVRRLLKAGETADSWFPDPTTVVTTTTVADKRLAHINWSHELAFIKAFAPDFHLPTDYPVYGDMDPQRRVENTKQCAKGTRYIAAELADTTTTVIPLIKGTNAGERRICQHVARGIDAPMVAKYGTQYFTVPGSGQFPALKEDVVDITREISDDQDVFVIGAMSPSGKFGVQKFPDAVVAVAGARWWDTVQPRSMPPDEMQATWSTFQGQVCDALGVPTPRQAALTHGDGTDRTRSRGS
jgi:hypothetical protein